MAFLTTKGLVVFSTLFTLYLLKRRFQRTSKHDLPLPPGPKGLPLLGNVNDLPTPGILECHHWLKHKDLYGPISSITVLGQIFIIVNDADIALELLRDRAGKHSGRPEMVFSGEMIGFKNTIAFQQPDQTFRQHRRNIAKVAGSSTFLAAFDRVQNEEAAHFLLNVLYSPDDLFEHIRKEAGAVILRVTYGYTPNAQGRDPLVDLVGKTMAEFADASVPGKWAVDVFPFLRYLPEWAPGTTFQRTARLMAAQLILTAETPYAFVKNQIREKKAKPSFLSQAIADSGSDDHIHKWSAVSMYTGGADTTVSALMTFFLAMAVFPDVQKKAQEELDRVIGSARLPVTSDKGSLPYIEAVVKETHRWHPVAPMALPHCCTEEDSIGGYRIPKGAMILPNNWWFTHNPSTYPDPTAFRPERYSTSSTHTAEPDPRTWTFGYGRRVCPGKYVADNVLFTTIAQSLAVFNIKKLVENGKTLEPRIEFEPGVVSHPVPYRVSIEPRNDGCRELVKSAEELYPWGESDAKALGGLG